MSGIGLCVERVRDLNKVESTSERDHKFKESSS